MKSVIHNEYSQGVINPLVAQNNAAGLLNIVATLTDGLFKGADKRVRKLYIDVLESSTDACQQEPSPSACEKIGEDIALLVELIQGLSPKYKTMSKKDRDTLTTKLGEAGMGCAAASGTLFE